MITIRHLLSQTSGLPTEAGTADLNTPSVSLEDRVRALADVRLAARPGEKFFYCNKNYATLGLVIELVSDLHGQRPDAVPARQHPDVVGGVSC